MSLVRGATPRVSYVLPDRSLSLSPTLSLSLLSLFSSDLLWVKIDRYLSIYLGEGGGGGEKSKDQAGHNDMAVLAQQGDFQRIGGGFVQQAPSVDAQLRAAKHRVLELSAQLEQRTRQLSAIHAKLTAETSARLTCSSQNEQLGRRLIALTGERERMAIQMAQLQERAQSAEGIVRQLRTVLAEQEQETEQLRAQALSSQQREDLVIMQEQLPQLRAAAAELPALRAAAAELPALRAAAAEQGFAARAECEALRREVGTAEARGAAAAEAARRVCREAEAMIGEREAVVQHGQRGPLAVPQLGSCASSGRAWRL